MDLHFLHGLLEPSDAKIVLLVMDGLGGLPREPGGMTELETARTPYLDRLALEGICGLQTPVASGITPGSGPGHLGLFGYNPLQYRVGRGALSALGIGFDLKPGDVAARGNFCSVDAEGRVTDRRAGRLETARNRELCDRLREIRLENAELHVETVKEHRFLLVLRGEDLSGDIPDTDPQETGVPPKEVRAGSPAAEKTAALVRQVVEQAREKLAGLKSANMILLRGFARKPDWPPFPEVFGLRSLALAGYPMYRGLARLLGMDVDDRCATTADAFALCEERWDDYDFFFLHVKETDARGEDGNFTCKVTAIEEVDRQVDRLRRRNPAVLIVTGDHSTPAVMAAHSWHPVPVLLWGRRCRPDAVQQFGETACIAGGLGPRLPAHHLLPLALAHAGRLTKFGA